MRIQKNRSALVATVRGIRRSKDGFGAELDLEVHRCEALAPAKDFIGAQPGQRLQAFIAVPEAVTPGQRLQFEATVLGGPDGERIVLTKPRDLGDGR
jgi:hypothetical protein